MRIDKGCTNSRRIRKSEKMIKMFDDGFHIIIITFIQNFFTLKNLPA